MKMKFWAKGGKTEFPELPLDLSQEVARDQHRPSMTFAPAMTVNDND